MKKTRKRLFAFSGLFVLMAQVLVMALCSIPAIAVTREETNRTLFNNEHGSATISYEEMESGGLNWTINLQKAAHDTATRFMVAMTADGQAIMPENVQTTMQSAPDISFTAGNGDGLMLAGVQEAAGGSLSGSAVITYQTSGNYGQMSVVPKLVTVGDTVTDLLAGNAGVVYDIPVKEEATATEGVVTGELPLTEEQTVTTEAPEAEVEVVESTTDSQVAEVTESTTESTVADEATEATEATESTEAEATETTDSSEAVVEGEATESTTEDSTATTESSSEAEDETEDSSEVEEDEADLNSDFTAINPTASLYTSLQFTKHWEGDFSNATVEEKTIYLQLMRRKKGSQDKADYEKYLTPEPFVYPDELREWKNLPVGDDPGYEYTVVEVANPNLDYPVYEMDQDPYHPEESKINSLTTVKNNNESIWEGPNPSYFIAWSKAGWFIWTADNLLTDQDKLNFAHKIAQFTPDTPQPHDGFISLSDKALLDPNQVQWVEGNDYQFGITTEVTYNDADIDVKVTFDDSSTWKQFFYGTSSVRKVTASNKYIPPTTINVEKQWMLEDGITIDNNEYNTQKDIQLVLQVRTSEEDEWKDVDGKFLDIPAGFTGDALKGSFKVPTMVDDGTGTYVNAEYQVVERYVDENGKTVNRVYGYSAKTDGYTITNTLLKTDLSFTKVDGQGKALEGVTFNLTRDGMEDKPWTSEPTTSDGAVNFSGLPVGHYTLTETGTAPGYDKLENSWGFTVTDTDGTEENMDIVWDEGDNPFGDENVHNNGTIVNNLKPFDLTVNKVDDLGGALVGAEFTLTGPNDYKQVITSTEENPLSSFTFTDLVVPEEGTNTYTLTETKAPDGYAKLLNPIIITIGYNDEGKLTITVDGEVVEFSLNEGDANNTFTYKVANKALVPLPATGGPGTLLFFVMGILAIAVTGIYFVSRQKQEVA